MERLVVVLSGLAGAAGIALAAVGSHAGRAGLGTAATMLVLHAAAALGLAWRSTPFVLAALLLLAGATLFAGDLAARAYLGTRLFRFAAPVGGYVMIAGWLGVALAALVGRR